MGLMEEDVLAALGFMLLYLQDIIKTEISHINYVPLLVLNRGANVQDRYIILDVNAAIAEYKAGNTTTVSDAVYQKLEYALEGCHTILGEKYDTAGSPPAGSAA